MMHRYTPPDRFVRIYVATRVTADEMWAIIRVQHYDHMMPFWDDDDEEALDRASWLHGFDDLKNWTEQEAFVDSHY